MELLDIASLEAWTELELFIHERSGLNASVFDHAGTRLTRVSAWANRLCPAVKAIPDGQQHICSCAHQVIANMARAGRAPVIEECDAGLLKFACPIHIEDEFIGVVGGCGLRLDNAEPDLFHLNKVTKLPLSELEAMAQETGAMTSAAVLELVEEVQRRVAEFVAQRSGNQLPPA